MIALQDPPYLSRRDLYASIGLLSEMEPMTEDLMRERAEALHRDDEYDSPHSRAWNVSFHCSEYPGDTEDACARYLVYRMMNIPSAEGPMAPWVTATGVVGKSVELDIVDAWFQGGRMLGVPEDPLHPERFQLGFVDPEYWLTGSTDLAILPRGSVRPVIVEIKGKSDDVLDEMINGRLLDRGGQLISVPRGPDPAHVRQLKATIGLAHEHDWGEVVVCSGCWRIIYADVFQTLCGPRHHVQHGRTSPNPLVVQAARDHNIQFCPWGCGSEGQTAFKLEQPTTGEIYYWSRSWPRGHPKHGTRVKSFFFEYDPAYMERGREVLREARDSFRSGTLPPRPRHFQWSSKPCSQCRHRAFCRLDQGVEPRKRKATMPPVERLADSNGILHALSVRTNYSYQSTRARVLSEWDAQDQSEEEERAQ